MAVSRLTIRPVDDVLGLPYPGLARRIDIFKEWDLQNLTKGNEYCPLEHAGIPKRVTDTAASFEIPHDSSWLLRFGIFEGPPGIVGVYRWIVLDPGANQTLDLPIPAA